MKHHHLLSILAAAGILLPAQHAAAFTSPLPEFGGAIHLAPKKGKKDKKGKKKKTLPVSSKQLFSPTEKQIAKAEEYLDSIGRPSYEDAIKNDDDKALYAILTTGEATAQQALFAACRWGKTHYVKLLLKAPDIDLNCDADYIWNGTPLIIAIQHGHLKTVKLLATSPGIDVNRRDEQPGMSPFGYAVEAYHKEMVQFLMRVPKIKIGNYSELELAIFKGNTAEVKRILTEQKPNINKKTELENNIDNSGGTPLIYAAGFGHTDIVKLLLEQPNININIEDDHGISALTAAAMHGHVDIMTILLQRPEIIINRQNNEGKNPLPYAAKNGHSEAVRLLVNIPGIVEEKLEENGEALYLAAENGHSEVVRLLVNIPWMVEEQGKVAFISAIEEKHVKCVKILLSTGKIDVNKPFRGETPLEIATRKSSEEIQELLRKAGAK